MASFPRGAVLRYTCHRSRGTQGARSHPAHLTYRRCYIPCRLPQPRTSPSKRTGGRIWMRAFWTFRNRNA